MRNPSYVLKSLEENAKTPGYRYERLYRNLYNPEFYLLAYKNIATSQGSMTPGADGISLDDMSMARIQRIYCPDVEIPQGGVYGTVDLPSHLFRYTAGVRDESHSCKHLLK